MIITSVIGLIFLTLSIACALEFGMGCIGILIGYLFCLKGGL
jgi:hypothetical protein